MGKIKEPIKKIRKITEETIMIQTQKIPFCESDSLNLKNITKGAWVF